MAKRQYLTPAIVPDGYDSDEPTADADITLVAHNSIFDPLDGSASHGTPDSDIEIDELESEGTAWCLVILVYFI